MDFGAPEDFVGHPVADAGEALLHEEDGFDRGAGAASQEFGDGGDGEGARRNWRGDRCPPGGRVGADVEEDAAEHAVVAEDEGRFAQGKDEVVVFSRGESGGLGGEFAGHAEVDAEPGVAAEAEEHLFRGGFGAEKFRTGECGFDQRW